MRLYEYFLSLNPCDVATLVVSVSALFVALIALWAALKIGYACILIPLFVNEFYEVSKKIHDRLNVHCHTGRDIVSGVRSCMDDIEGCCFVFRLCGFEKDILNIRSKIKEAQEKVRIRVCQKDLEHDYCLIAEEIREMHNNLKEHIIDKASKNFLVKSLFKRKKK